MGIFPDADATRAGVSDDLFASSSAFRVDVPVGAPALVRTKKAKATPRGRATARDGAAASAEAKPSRAAAAAATPSSSSAPGDESDGDASSSSSDGAAAPVTKVAAARANAGRGDESDSDDERRRAVAVTGSGPRDRDAGATAEELARTVFVGNVPVTVKAKKLKQAFGKFGVVASVRLRNVPVDADGNEPRKVKVLQKKLNAERGNATAFVVFTDAESAQKAAKEMNMKSFEGRHVRVDLASNPSIVKSEVVYDQNRSVFLGQLPFNVDDEEVIRLFNKNAEYPELRKSVEAVRIVRDRKTTMGKGIGFVLFKTKEQARTALLLDGSKIGDREIRVSKASRAKAPKPGAASKARPEPKISTGAERRNPKLKDSSEAPHASGSVRAANAWEGSRSRPGGKSQKTAFRGGDARPTPGGIGKPSMKKAGTKERTGKRPAVAARKAKMKAKAAASGGKGRS